MPNSFACTALNEAFAAGGVLKDSDEETKPKSEPPAKEAPPTKRPAFPLQFTLRTIALSNNIIVQPGIGARPRRQLGDSDVGVAELR